MKLTARGASDEARQLIPVFDGPMMEGEHSVHCKSWRSALDQLRFALLSIGLFVPVACDPLCLARGRIVDPAGLTGAKCAVKLQRAGEPEKYGSPCRQPATEEGSPERLVVKLGQEFQCTTIPGLKGEQLDLSVICDGYEPYRSTPFEWKVEGFTCSARDLGAIALRRAAPADSASSPRGK